MVLTGFLLAASLQSVHGKPGGLPACETTCKATFGRCRPGGGGGCRGPFCGLKPAVPVVLRRCGLEGVAGSWGPFCGAEPPRTRWIRSERSDLEAVLDRGQGLAGLGVEGGLAGGELLAEDVEGGGDLGVRLGFAFKGAETGD